MDETGSAEPQTPTAEGRSSPRPTTQKSSSHAPAKADAAAVESHDFANPTLNIIRRFSRKASTSSLASRDPTPPPLPPRPALALLSRPSTAHSIAPRTRNLSVADDAASILSYARTVDAGYQESILGEVMGPAEKSEQEKSLLRSLGQKCGDAEAQSMFPPDADFEAAFAREFDDVDELAPDGSNQEAMMLQWRAKLKHFLILSSAGKPIYSRHGDDQLITNYIGVVQTIISFYQSTHDTLRGFTAGQVRFVVMSKGPLNLVAITRLPESDSQLRSQLEALYMQILSTLTLPSMERMFAARANYDLRRPLQGTETLLSALADGFTRGSPSTLLSALECLKLRKSHRTAINHTLLKARSEKLLYGLLVASGKLVSVVRPKKHSLHPGDLHLIFNMLFEAGSVKAGGGENWIPLCLPGFNNTGYLYMYVSFLNLEDPTEHMQQRPRTSDGADDEVAVLLISADILHGGQNITTPNSLAQNLQRNGSIEAIRTAVHQGRPTCTDIVPGTPLRHFLYKSRGNVQFTMPSYAPYFNGDLERRRLIDVYNKLHSNVHSKPASLKVHHETNTTCMALAWSTPLFELYAVAPANTSRAALAQSANQIVQWVRREEERVFIIGGAVF
ncbi:uncharacterized protein SETTUDRAFT_167514 [Exserohilum turcica Et28A]|uniref:Vacuolar fusion protein MON1 n=1 Tax=Exserohilum turcicum (strain 28A) TaxID=671987 RepID=R0KKP5_EXST2|nr:uncharacterized protein SETTUDRAFT_167514 [Exserohilum turcica Et28A]EOA89694.1 hypothetical protein SETTUDRAFT_167514 [Exserohilum turcica Et28A]